MPRQRKDNSPNENITNTEQNNPSPDMTMNTDDINMNQTGMGDVENVDMTQAQNVGNQNKEGNQSYMNTNTAADTNLNTDIDMDDEEEEGEENASTRHCVNEETFGNDLRKMQFYERLRSKVSDFSTCKAGKFGSTLTDYLFLLPDLFVLICRLALDERVPGKKKLFAGAVLAYMVLPIDIIPDFLPVIGQLDDLVLVIMALNQMLNGIEEQVLLDNWSGEGNILHHIQQVTAQAEQFLDKNILQKIRTWISKKS